MAQCRRNVLVRSAEPDRANLVQPLIVLFAESQVEGPQVFLQVGPGAAPTMGIRGVWASAAGKRAAGRPVLRSAELVGDRKDPVEDGGALSGALAVAAG